MTFNLTSGQLSILHSLRDGDDPVLRAPDSELIYYVRDLARLTGLGLVERLGARIGLTPLGVGELSNAGSSCPVSERQLQD